MSLTFEEIVEKVRNFKVKPSQEDYLEFYGYYKQATAGDCDTEEPEEPLKKALWKSWKERKGMTADDAKAYYVKCYQKFSPKYTGDA